MPPATPSFGTAVRRGLRRRCPRCGTGRLFRGWYKLNTRCSACDLQFEPNPGDTWGFWVLVDRVVLFVAMVALYVGVTPEGWLLRGVFLVLVAAPLVATMPHRHGAFLAIDYLSRSRWK